MNTANPDVIHPLKAYAVVFEAALGIRPDSDTKKLLRAKKIPGGWYVPGIEPLDVSRTLQYPEVTDRLVQEFEIGLVPFFQEKREGTSLVPLRFLETISTVYGIEDGQFHPLEELALQWSCSRQTINAHRQSGLYQVRLFLQERHSIEAIVGDGGQSLTTLATALRRSLTVT